MDSSASTPRETGPLPAAEDPDLQRRLVTAFLRHVPDAVYFKDRESRFIAVSRSLAEKSGVPAASMVGKTDFDIFTECHARAARADEESILLSGEPILGKIEMETWPDGRVTWVSTSKLPLQDEDGAVVGTFGISRDVTEAKRFEMALEKANKELVFTSRLAGMAEVATSVLHNVGNVLNSVNVSSSVLSAGLRRMKTGALANAAALLQEHVADAGTYLSTDPRGRVLPEFLAGLARHFAEERDRLLQELHGLRQSLDHIKDIVAMQQAYAHLSGGAEPLAPAALMEDAVRMNAAAITRHDVQLLREYQPVPPVRAEKAKVLQILVNLIRNAKYALDDGAPPAKVMTLRIELGPPGWVNLIVADNGVGIPPENMSRIFNRGFTTRKDGHGFGLSSAIGAARELHGSLTAASDGPGRGAAFTLQLPVAEEPAAAKPG